MTDITAIKTKCMAGLGIIPGNYEPYRDKAIALAKEGQIDPVSNLGRTRAFWPFYDEDKDSYFTQDGVAMRMVKNMVDTFGGAHAKK